MEGYKKDLLNFVKFKVKGESDFHSLQFNNIQTPTHCKTNGFLLLNEYKLRHVSTVLQWFICLCSQSCNFSLMKIIFELSIILIVIFLLWWCREHNFSVQF